MGWDLPKLEVQSGNLVLWLPFLIADLELVHGAGDGGPGDENIVVINIEDDVGDRVEGADSEE